jgi:hypothetical protein
MANHDEIWKERENLDRALDSVLAKYGAVEPREGLEERILANLRAPDTQSALRTWWNWGVAAALAAVLIIAAAVVWRWNQRIHEPVAIHPPALKQAPVPDFASRHASGAPPRKSIPHRTPRHRPKGDVVAAGPKLDVFPSPLPLSEQEKILASYVAQDPQRAALVAEARMDDLRHEVEERRQIVADERDNTR